MSQPASPIGSVEFIVKFDTMQGSFVGAMKQAFKDADIELGTDPQVSSKIDEILHNIRYRLRTPFSGDYKQFRSVAVPEIEFAKSEKAITDFASALRSKQMVIKKPEESQEEYIERSKESAKTLYERWILMIEKALKDESFFRKNQNKLVNLQGAIQQAMSGSWEYMVRSFVEQVISEDEVKAAMRQRLKQFGIETGGTERRWSKATQRIEKPGATKEIKTETEFLKAMGKTSLTPEQIKDIIEWDPKEWKKVEPEVKTELNNLLNTYWVEAMSGQIPNTILRIWFEEMEKSDWWASEVGIDIAKFGYIKHDILNIITESQIENFTKFLREYDVSEEEIEKIIRLIEAQIKEFGGWGLLPWEGKVIGSLAKWYTEGIKGRDINLMATFGIGGPTGGIGGVSSTKILEDIKTMSKEDLIDFILEGYEKEERLEIMKWLERNADNSEKLDFLTDEIQKIKDNPDLAKVFKRGI